MIRRRNLPNVITAVRMLLAFPVASALARYDLSQAGGLLLVAIGTDLLDAWLARRWDACSTFGAYFDATADFFLLGMAFAVLVSRGVYPAWMLALMGLMFAQWVVTSRFRAPIYDPVGKYYGAALYGALFALILLPDALLGFASLVTITGISALSLSTRARWLLISMNTSR